MPLFRRIIAAIVLLAGLTASDARASSSQDGYSLSGTVTDSTSGEALYMAEIVVRELGLWTATDEKGRFSIGPLPQGHYIMEISLLGYESRGIGISISGRDITDLNIRLRISSLYLNEVVVTAEEGGGLSSVSRISTQTIEHVQPSSLRDVMQLLPGSVTSNPSLTSANTLSIRDISDNSANIAGTALILDGAALSNDANMQMLSAGTAVNSGNSNTASTAGGGIDVRQISTDNIESVEVIRGIPSVVYGDMTSGAVIVNTKAGVTPWQVRLKADPQLKQVSFGKGFSLGENRGVMNFDADYANAVSDVRTPTSAFNRVNFQAGYSNSFAQRRLTFNARLRAGWSNATNISDPDLFLDEISQSRDLSLRLNINGRWNINRPWISSLEYLATGSWSDQYSRDRSYQGSAGYTPVATVREDFTGTGFFTQPQYYSDVSVYGEPVDANIKLTANQFGQYGKVSNRVLLGGEWKVQGNVGEGKVFDPLCPPNPGASTSLRERSYSDIPFLHRLTGYIEDNLRFPLGPTSLEIQAGVRINGLMAGGIGTSNFLTAEPRANLKYHIAGNGPSSWLRELSIRGGWGISYKMPSMVYLYPEAAYKDMVSFSYNDFDANGYGMNVITTKKVETVNPDLTPQRSRNIEAGVEFDATAVSGSIVYFNEYLTDGYGFVTEYVPMMYNRYGYTWGADGNPSQTTLPSGVRPVFLDGQVSVGGETLPFITDTTFMSYSRPVNNITNRKWGVEIALDFARIRALNTTISLSGAYMNIETHNGGETMRLYSGGTGGRSYPYVGVYAGSTSASNGSVRERLNTNLMIVTHIPRIAMVVTLTAQMVFLDRSQSLSEANGVSQPYFYDESGRRVSGAEALNDREHTKLINPLYIINRAGDIIPFTQEMEADPTYANLILSTNTANYYIRQSYPFYGMLNIRVTKQIKDIATVSFYANNFLNFRGRVRNSVTGYLSDRNTPIYFGAEVKITIK